MDSNLYLKKLKTETYYTRQDLFDHMKGDIPELCDTAFRYRLKKMLAEGDIIRVGRNVYQKNERCLTNYSYKYSEIASEIANHIEVRYPKLDFRIFESVQLNEFLNHQIAHNTIFVFVEADLSEFVFEMLKEIYPGKVLIKPSLEEFHRYWIDGMTVIDKLTTETPKGKNKFWHTELEKMLVDIIRNELIMSNFERSELPQIYEYAFAKYVVDESQLFRYARRRTIEKEIIELIENETNVKLRLER